MQMMYTTALITATEERNVTDYFNSTNLTTGPSQEPKFTLEVSEVISLIFYMASISIGMPLNALAFFQVTRRYFQTRSRIFLLYLSLNLSDLLVLLFYPLVRGIWTWTFEWHGGDIGCRVYKFSESVAFAISANVMVCIALDRLYCLRSPFKAESLKRVRKMLAVAWLLAFLVASPQLYFWTAPVIDFNNHHFSQCTTLWLYEEHLHDTKQRTIDLDENGRASDIYLFYVLVVMFWVPMSILVVSYALILHAVDRRSSSRLSVVRRTVRKYSTALARTNTINTRADLAANAVSGIQQLNQRPNSPSSIQPERNTANGEQKYRKQKSFRDDGLRRVCGGEQVQRARSRTIRITLMLCTFYLICWLPCNFLSAWRLFNKDSYDEIGSKWHFLSHLIVLNSIINPLEPGTDAEIKEFVTSGYGCSYDLYSKIDVNGSNAHPLWTFLKEKQGGTLGNFIKWNFSKFLISRDGVPVKRYSPTTDPNSCESDIIKQLEAKAKE